MDVRDSILDADLASAIGKPGRAQVAHVLDYAHELFDIGRPSRHTRDKFFAAITDLNHTLDQRGFGYYIFGGIHWDRDAKAMERVSLDVYAIQRARHYRAGDRVIPALHVSRVGGGRASDLASHRLGFTSAGHSDALIVPVKIERELELGLLPALDPAAFTPLFYVSESEKNTAWYRDMRRVLAEVLASDFERIAADWKVDKSGLHRALAAAVEVHEVQHLLDFEDDRRRHAREGKPRPRALFGPFQRMADNTEDKSLARASLYEASAHLAQMARDPATTRMTLSVVTSYAFTDECDHADCLAALILLDELALELGHFSVPRFTAGDSYEIADVGDVFTVLMANSPERLAAACRAIWETLFQAPLPAITAVEAPVRPS